MKRTRYVASLWAMAAVFVLTGCTTRYAVRVDALASSAWQARPGMTYQWKSDIEEVAETDLFFLEVAQRMDQAMQEKGYRRVQSGAAPDIEVFINAHISQPLTETQTRTDPVYAQTYGRTRVISIPVVNSEGKVVNYIHRTLYSPPRTEYVGSVQRSEQITVYDKILRLSARLPAVDGKRGEEVWSLSVALRSRSTDYRGFLPYLLAAAAPHIGSRTQGEIIIEIPENDPRVQSSAP